MADNTDTLFDLDYLLIEIAAAERAARMSPSDVAVAEARMNQEIITELSNVGGYTSLSTILAVRQIALQNRLHAAQSRLG
jgi:hypothetical protein